MTDEATLIRRRAEALVMQASMNAQSHGGDHATAVVDLMVAFVLRAKKSGADPDKAMTAIWENAKAIVADFWPDEKVN